LVDRSIAVICSLDTKRAEAAYIAGRIAAAGFSPCFVDLSTAERGRYPADVNADDILAELGIGHEQAARFTRSEWVSAMRDGLARLLPKLYAQGKFCGAVALGGLQNTLMATGGLRELPVGVPKVMLSTVASGMRVLDPFVGTKDVMLMHSVADLSGVNPVTEIVLANAVSAVIGMVEHSGKTLADVDEPLIGATIMGVIGRCASGTIERIERAGYHVVAFHSTGKGGRAMEEMIQCGKIAASMELSLHELVCNDIVCGGYAMGAPRRLCAGVEKGIPMLVTPGGLDFIDYSAEDFKNGRCGGFEGRKFTYHNSSVVHIKLDPQTAARAAKGVAQRLNRSRAPVTVMLPLKGFRTETGEGEALFDPDTDGAIINTFRRKLAAHIRMVEIDANINDDAFIDAAENEMLMLLRQCNIQKKRGI
jgi:uncharacterized protein (UPF0261 family)